MNFDYRRELLWGANKLKCKVAISGYWAALYEERLKNWHSVKFNAMTRGRDRREEWLWMNYPDPEQLHGYRYLGDNFRERELLKKKKSRWIKKLKGMKPQERKALLSALDETFLKSQDLFKDD